MLGDDLARIKHQTASVCDSSLTSCIITWATNYSYKVADFGYDVQID